MTDAYKRAGVDTASAERAVAKLVGVLGALDPGRARRAVLGTGHYANVIAIDERTGIALCMDGVGSKLIVAEQLGRFDTVGIDCVAMNVNDAICVGAEPVAMLDYIAVERSDPGIIEQIAVGLKTGAEEAGVEIPSGELAELPELLRGHPSPRGLDLVGTCVGVVALERVITGANLAPGDAVIGLPAHGIHANGLTLARRAFPEPDEYVPELGTSAGEALLQPTRIYVRAVAQMLSNEVGAHALFHITGGGLINLLRLRADVGYRIYSPLPRPPMFQVIAERCGIGPAEMFEVFNMGCGFCCVVAAEDCDRALSLLRGHYPDSAVIGEVTDRAGTVELPTLGLRGSRGAGFQTEGDRRS